MLPGDKAFVCEPNIGKLQPLRLGRHFHDAHGAAPIRSTSIAQSLRMTVLGNGLSVLALCLAGVLKDCLRLARR